MSALWIASVQAALLAGLVAAALWLVDRRAPHAVSPAVRSALWWIVVLRLALPIAVPDPLGVPRPDWWSGSAEPGTIGADAGAASRAATATPTDAAPAEPRAEQPDADADFAWPLAARRTAPSPPAAAGTPRRASSSPEPAPLSAARGSGSLPSSIDAPTAPPAATAPAPALPSRAALVAIWLCGAAVCVARAVGGEARFRRRVLAAATPVAGPARAALDRALAASGVRRPVALLATDALAVPAAHGLWHWRILLPNDASSRLDADGLAFVIGHELAHLRRRDPAVDLALTAICAAHWFNPAAWLAVRALRGEREALRDADALASSATLDPDRCARALLSVAGRAPDLPPTLACLTPGRRASLFRRIEMLVQERPFSRAGTWAGGLCCAALGWAGLFGAATPPPAQVPRATTPGEAPAPSARATRGIRVVRETPEPEWEPALRARLATPVRWTSRAPVDAVFAALGEQLGITIAIEGDFEQFDGRPELDPLATAMPASDALDLACWMLSHQAHVDWRIVAGGVELFQPGDQSDLDLRFYEIEPLLARGYATDELVDLLMLVDDAWEHAGGIEAWSGQLLVRTTSRSHDRVLAALDRLLEGPTTSAPKAAIAGLGHRLDPAERPELREPLDADRLAAVAAGLGVTLWIAPDRRSDFDGVTVDPRGEPLGALLRRVAGAAVTVHASAVLVGSGLPLATWVFDLAPLVAPTASELRSIDAETAGDAAQRAEWLAQLRDEKSEQLLALVRSYADPASWEQIERAEVRRVGPVLVLHNTRPALEHAERFLTAARRALATAD